MDVQSSLEKVKSECSKFEGDASSGTFSGDGVDGSYSIAGNVVSITITCKPFFISWAGVQSHIENYFR